MMQLNKLFINKMAKNLVRLTNKEGELFIDGDTKVKLIKVGNPMLVNTKVVGEDNLPVISEEFIQHHAPDWANAYNSLKNPGILDDGWHGGSYLNKKRIIGLQYFLVE